MTKAKQVTPGAPDPLPSPQAGEGAERSEAGGGAPQPTPSLVVRARRAARRRAGMSFGLHDTIVPLDALSAEQRAAIEADPELIVARTH